MKFVGILSALLAATVAVLAQSNGTFTPVPPPSTPPAQAGAQLTVALQPPPPPAVTNTLGPRSMSLADCMQVALGHNFDVQIQRINPQISLYDLNAAYSGYDVSFNAAGQHSFSDSGSTFQNGLVYPGTKQNANSFNSGFSGVLPWGLNYDLTGRISDTYGSSGSSFTNLAGKPFENSAGQIGITMTQPLLKNFWIDSTRLNIKVAKNRLKYTEQGLREQLITTVTAVANAYYELIFAQENIKVQQQALDLAQTQLDQDRQRLQIGTLAILSVQQDESQVAQSKANLISAQSTLDTDQNILKHLLTDDFSKWHSNDIQPTEALTAPAQSFDLQDSWNKGLTQRPDLLQAKLNVEAQGIQLKYNFNQLFPELDLVGSYGFTGAGTEYSDVFGQFDQGNRPFYTYGAQMTMPLGNINARNQYKAAKATLKQVLLQLKQTEQNIMELIDNAIKTAQSDYQSVEATKQARIYAEAALDAQQKTYAAGKATTLDVLISQNNLTGARSQELRALANYNQALANLASQEGVTLERYNINLNIETK